MAGYCKLLQNLYITMAVEFGGSPGHQLNSNWVVLVEQRFAQVCRSVLKAKCLVLSFEHRLG